MKEKIKITVETDDDTMVLSFSSECTIYELANYLKLIPKFLTYSDLSVNEIFYKDEL
jgi:hypothetical protein